MKLNPLNNNVVILIDNEVQEVRNGIILANPNVTAKPNVGTVVAVHENSPIVQVGQKVMYLKHSGTGFKEDILEKESPEYKVISERDILGIVEDGNYG
jgi:co-chaperonin GroES (HSP10)